MGWNAFLFNPLLPYGASQEVHDELCFLFFPFPHLAAIVQKTYIREHQVVAADTSLHFELDYLLRDHARATRLGFILLPPFFFFLVLCCGDRGKEKFQTSYYVLVLTLTRCEK